MRQALLDFSQSPVYLAWMIFLGAFPVVTAMLSIDSSRRFVIDRRSEPREGDDGLLPDEENLELAREAFELLTVLIPARNEEALLGATIELMVQRRPTPVSSWCRPWCHSDKSSLRRSCRC